MERGEGREREKEGEAERERGGGWMDGRAVGWMDVTEETKRQQREKKPREV